jgi:hypothetical protein
VRGSGPRGSARSDCKLLRPRATCQTHLLANGGNVVRGHHFGRRAAMMKKALAGQKRGAAVRSRGTWKLVSARCCVSGTNWRARRCGRSSLGRRSLRCWQSILSIVALVGSPVSPWRRRHQHRAKRRALELRKIFSAGCALRTYSASPVAGSVPAITAASSTYGTYVHTHRNKAGRVCARLGSIRSNADAD